MVIYTSQLLYGLIIRAVVCEYFPSMFRRLVLRREAKSPSFHSEETEAEFEKRKSRVPPFLRKYIKRRKNQSVQSAPSNEIVSIDSLTVEEIPDSYAKLLLSPNDLSEIDTSRDYQVEELESEYESEIEEVNIDIQRGNLTFESRGALMQNSALPIHELFDGEELTEMFAATNSTFLDIFQKHMQYNEQQGRLTRSRYRGLLKSIAHPVASVDETERLLQVLVSRRMNKSENERNGENERSLDCVICQTNPREIITWPCKCFAICEGCRLSLVSKGIEGCVCCRRDVEGVSKIFVP